MTLWGVIRREDFGVIPGHNLGLTKQSVAQPPTMQCRTMSSTHLMRGRLLRGGWNHGQDVEYDVDGLQGIVHGIDPVRGDPSQELDHLPGQDDYATESQDLSGDEDKYPLALEPKAKSLLHLGMAYLSSLLLEA